VSTQSVVSHKLPCSEMAARTENSVQQHTLMMFGMNVSLMELQEKGKEERERERGGGSRFSGGNASEGVNRI